jgi:hypothetical protein
VPERKENRGQDSADESVYKFFAFLQIAWPILVMLLVYLLLITNVPFDWLMLLGLPLFACVLAAQWLQVFSTPAQTLRRQLADRICMAPVVAPKRSCSWPHCSCPPAPPNMEP